MPQATTYIRLLSLLVLGAAIAGCSDSAKPSAAAKEEPKQNKAEPTAKGKAAEDEHAHKPSAHGGIIVALGADSYHAEAVFEKGGSVRLYMLGKDESKVLEIEANPINGFVKSEGAGESEPLIFEPKPQDGDKKGMTSLFVAKLPKELAGKAVEVTVPSIRVGGERFRIGFKSKSEGDGHGMPTKVADAAETKLYLTPGGKYSEADIKANGNMTASEKFKGLKAEHDLKPKTGEKICPITLTKANAVFSWVVGGKTYEFCCPPCVDEFVALAKEKPESIEEPEQYRKK